MPVAQRPAARSERLAGQRLRLVQAAAVLQQDSQVAQAAQRVHMLVAQR